jgi:hypothetical protein
MDKLSHSWLCPTNPHRHYPKLFDQNGNRVEMWKLSPQDTSEDIRSDINKLISMICYIKQYRENGLREESMFLQRHVTKGYAKSGLSGGIPFFCSKESSSRAVQRPSGQTLLPKKACCLVFDGCASNMSYFEVLQPTISTQPGFGHEPQLLANTILERFSLTVRLRSGVMLCHAQ